MFRIPKHDQSILIFGESELPHLRKEALRLLVWNVWKGRGRDIWRRDLLSLSLDRDLILLQEAVADSSMSSYFQEASSRYEWRMAASFEWRERKTGVATGAVAKPFSSRYLRGREREFFLWTPKVSLSTSYSLHEGPELLVINTHVVNFTTTSSFVRFVEELVSLIEHHHGPLILAGDFNTWNLNRWQSLLGILFRLGVTPVTFGEDPRFLKLDHVFSRGLKMQSAVVRHDIKSSDHYPLLVDFEFC
ncbi:MAG: endonuclease/exonuclease/phosphatase family protein [Bdellovibrionaceae bacterium]|nr:endonuclease/exonuclease/phosphatase family protein [Pseudobdellovibrionaceae bacterium]